MTYTPAESRAAAAEAANLRKTASYHKTRIATFTPNIAQRDSTVVGMNLFLAPDHLFKVFVCKGDLKRTIE